MVAARYRLGMRHGRDHSLLPRCLASARDGGEWMPLLGGGIRCCPVNEGLTWMEMPRETRTTDAVTIREATLADLPLLLRYRRAMAEETDGADEAALHRMLAALEPYLRFAIPEGRWHSWIADPGGCASLEIVQWVPGRLDPTPRRAWIHSLYIEPPFRRRGIARQLTQTIISWCRGQGFEWIYLHASEQGRPLYESLGFEPSSEMRLKLRSR
jgi:GNAT superfamily N-acetyltransferase